jgi:holo-[acyl-carrier protein] synthase
MTSSAVAQSQAMSKVRVGVDLVQISRIEQALADFGDRYIERVFTDDEAAYARSVEGGLAGRLATRFAAKEAAKKALDLDGVGWRDIEVRKTDSGAVELQLHGRAREAAVAAGARDLALSMSRDGDYATATLIVMCEKP